MIYKKGKFEIPYIKLENYKDDFFQIELDLESDTGGNIYMFSFHSAEWWKNLWEKTGIVDITACYNIPDPKALWYPWAHWSKESLGFNDVEFLNADTENQITLFVMAAEKK